MRPELNLRLSTLKRYAVYDCNGMDIGEPIDIALDSLDEYRAAHIIIGGGFIEELLEELERRDNIDEFFHLSQIKEVLNEEIHLTISENELSKTDSSGNLPENLIRFTEIHRMKVYDEEGNPLGETIDIEFKNGRTYLVIQDFSFNRNMSLSSDYKQRVDFIIPISKMTFKKDEIVAPLKADSRMELVVESLKPKNRGIDTIYI